MAYATMRDLCTILSEVDRGKITIGWDRNDRFVVYVSGEKAPVNLTEAARKAMDDALISRAATGLYITGEGLTYMRRNWPTWRPTR